MKAAPHILGLFMVDQREFVLDMHAAIDGHEAGTVPDIAAAVKSHMVRHKFFADRAEVATAIHKLVLARNWDRAHKLVNNGVGAFAFRAWVRVLMALVVRLFWPTLAALAAITIYHCAKG